MAAGSAVVFLQLSAAVCIYSSEMGYDRGLVTACSCQVRKAVYTHTHKYIHKNEKNY